MGDDLRESAYSFAQALEKSSREEERRTNFLKWAGDYLGEKITSLYDFETLRSTSNNGSISAAFRSPRNLTRTLVDTAMSRFAKTETRVIFATNGATPDQQERSKDCSDASNALIEQTEGEECLRAGALHACVFDNGFVKTFERDGEPVNEHVPAWEVMFEPVDAHRGKPRILVQRSSADKDALVAEFCAAPEGAETHEARVDRSVLAEDIRASSSEGLTTSDHTLSDQHCVVYELWRLPVGKYPGRHVIVTDHALLLDEEWTDKTFPFTIFVWSKPLFGSYGVSIANIVSAVQDELNGTATRISQILRKMAIPLWTETGPASDKAVSAVPLRSGSDAIGDVVVVGPGRQLNIQSAGDKVGAELFNHEDRVWNRGFEMTGINQSSSIGSRPAGLNSAPAQREWNEINQDRLSIVALDYQRAHVHLAQRLLDCLANLPEYEITVMSTNGRWMRKMKASDLQLDRADFVIQAFPISALPLTPTGKLAAAADLLQMGAIDRDTFMEIVQIPDLESKLNITLQSRRATEAIVAKMLRTGQYEAPLDMLEPMYASKYVVAKYLEGVANGMSDEKLELLKDWSDDLAARIKKAAADAAAQSAAAAPNPLAGTSIAPLPAAPLAPAVTTDAFGATMAGAG